ncbi:MAG: RagB/SusD family nutrient uptake outer membrane protein [Bacteroidaceae bacterium]
MKIKYLLSICAAAVLSFSACVGDLDVQPLDPNVTTAEIAYATPGAFNQSIAKIYAVWAMSGQDGEGSTDIAGLDPGNAQLLRSYWNLQVITTDECKNAWGDSWVPEINGMLYSSTKNESIEGVYQRCMFTVALCNEFILQANASSVLDAAQKTQYVAEARFNRALAYEVLMDLYATPPFITEENYSLAPSALTRADLFDWIETELNECRDHLPTPSAVEYGRASQGAVDFLLARMYLNAEVFKGEAMYTECIAACNRLFTEGYALSTTYANLFKADNNITSSKEIIFPIVFDGTKTKTWGGMTYLIASSRSGKAVDLNRDGVNEGWDGNRATSGLTSKFDTFDPAMRDAAMLTDARGIFDSNGRSEAITTTSEGTFVTEGWAVYKFTNVKSDGSLCEDTTFPETDFPMFRLGDAYLMYAEAVVRGGSGATKAEAVTLVNKLRERGYGGAGGDISESDLDLDFVLDERARELYWEGTRRTDLVRFGKYTGSQYVWDFKGGVATGVAVNSYKNVFPIPVSDLSVNGNLQQNPGY